jgi:hypothetical protein
VRDICIKTGAELIDAYSSFVYSDGSIVKQYLARDGIHHNKYGFKTPSRRVYIVKRKLNHANGDMRPRYPRKENSGAGSPRYRQYNKF